MLKIFYLNVQLHRVRNTFANTNCQQIVRAVQPPFAVELVFGGHEVATAPRVSHGKENNDGNEEVARLNSAEYE